MAKRWIVALLALLLVLGGCSSTSGDSSYAPGPAVDAEAGDGADNAGGGQARSESQADAADDGSAGDSDAAIAEAGTQTEGPMMVRKVEVSVLVEDVTAAATRIRATATGAGGWIASEEVVPRTDTRPGNASLVLRVPSADLDATVNSLGELGEVVSTRSSAEDVTAEYRDVEARVATLEAGAERLRELIAKAESVEAIAALERELSDREADLDALKARRKVLAQDVSLSTITVHLSEESSELGQTASQTGFVAGLERGWQAFTDSMTVLITAAGALLPFLVLAAVIGIPLLLWRRRRRTAGARPRTEATSTAYPAGRKAEVPDSPDARQAPESSRD